MTAQAAEEFSEWYGKKSHSDYKDRLKQEVLECVREREEDEKSKS